MSTLRIGNTILIFYTFAGLLACGVVPTSTQGFVDPDPGRGAALSSSLKLPQTQRKDESSEEETTAYSTDVFDVDMETDLTSDSDIMTSTSTHLTSAKSANITSVPSLPTQNGPDAGRTASDITSSIVVGETTIKLPDKLSTELPHSLTPTSSSTEASGTEILHLTETEPTDAWRTFTSILISKLTTARASYEDTISATTESSHITPISSTSTNQMPFDPTFTDFSEATTTEFFTSEEDNLGSTESLTTDAMYAFDTSVDVDTDALEASTEALRVTSDSFTPKTGITSAQDTTVISHVSSTRVTLATLFSTTMSTPRPSETTAIATDNISTETIVIASSTSSSTDSSTSSAGAGATAAGTASGTASGTAPGTAVTSQGVFSSSYITQEQKDSLSTSTIAAEASTVIRTSLGLRADTESSSVFETSLTSDITTKSSSTPLSTKSITESATLTRRGSSIDITSSLRSTDMTTEMMTSAQQEAVTSSAYTSTLSEGELPTTTATVKELDITTDTSYYNSTIESTGTTSTVAMTLVQGSFAVTTINGTEAIYTNDLTNISSARYQNLYPTMKSFVEDSCSQALATTCTVMAIDFGSGSLLVKFNVAVPDNTTVDRSALVDAIASSNDPTLGIDPNSVTIVPAGQLPVFNLDGNVIITDIDAAPAQYTEDYRVENSAKYQLLKSYLEDWLLAVCGRLVFGNCSLESVSFSPSYSPNGIVAAFVVRYSHNIDIGSRLKTNLLASPPSTFSIYTLTIAEPIPPTPRSGLSEEAIIGIAIGAALAFIVILLILLVVIVCWATKKRNSKIIGSGRSVAGSHVSSNDSSSVQHFTFPQQYNHDTLTWRQAQTSFESPNGFWNRAYVTNERLVQGGPLNRELKARTKLPRHVGDRNNRRKPDISRQTSQESRTTADFVGDNKNYSRTRPQFYHQDSSESRPVSKVSDRRRLTRSEVAEVGLHRGVAPYTPGSGGALQGMLFQSWDDLPTS